MIVKGSKIMENSNAMTVFENSDFDKVRIVNIDGEPWFVGKDVCEILGYKNETQAMNSNCNGIYRIYPIADKLGRQQNARIISEPDLYRLIIPTTTLLIITN